MGAKAKRATDALPEWTCQGQSDLTELVDTEHISGSMPAGEADRERARQDFYEQLRQRPHAQQEDR